VRNISAASVPDQCPSVPYQYCKDPRDPAYHFIEENINFKSG
jgi:hypothetical protein